jgi:hypothetical protein
MSDAYTDRCNILAKWLEVRNDVVTIRNVYEVMASTHTAYRTFQEMIEEKRAILNKMQREHYWLESVLDTLGRGT